MRPTGKILQGRSLPRRITILILAGLLVGCTLATNAAAFGATRAGSSDRPPFLADATDPAVTTLAHDRDISIREAQRRIGWQDPAYHLGLELQQALGDRFGGLWIDEADGGRIKVGIVGGDATGASTLIQRRKLAAVTDLVPVRYSYRHLEAADAWLATEIAKANRGAARRLETSILVDKNAVELKVPRGQRLSAAQQSVVNKASRRLGAARVLGSWPGRLPTDTCTWIQFSIFPPTFTCDPSLRGGLGMFAFLPNEIRLCTNAFYAKSKSDGKPFVMTAGHCGGEGTVWKIYLPKDGSFHTVGAVHNQTYSDNNDYGIITINNPSGWSPKPWVYVHASSTTVENPSYTIHSVSGSSIGMRVCLSGAVTGTDCGDVTELGIGGPGGYAQANYCRNDGDSGGPIYSSGAARGIHHGPGDATCTGRYQGVIEAANALNVSVVVG
jgi:streptogrisin C